MYDTVHTKTMTNMVNNTIEITHRVIWWTIETLTMKIHLNLPAWFKGATRACQVHSVCMLQLWRLLRKKDADDLMLLYVARRNKQTPNKTKKPRISFKKFTDERKTFQHWLPWAVLKQASGTSSVPKTVFEASKYVKFAALFYAIEAFNKLWTWHSNGFWLAVFLSFIKSTWKWWKITIAIVRDSGELDQPGSHLDQTWLRTTIKQVHQDVWNTFNKARKESVIRQGVQGEVEFSIPKTGLRMYRCTDIQNIMDLCVDNEAI